MASQTETKDSVTKLKAPNKFNVIMLNDDVTPMDFVIHILVIVFNRTPETAKDIMLEVHEKGRSIAGTFSYEVAEQKAADAINLSRDAGFPLGFDLEESI